MSTYNLERLDNGLRILTAPMDSAQSVTCAIMLAAGSRYETPETNGIAHFAEHMFFKGTERRPTARDISMEIDGIGGEFNAFTGKEYTGYYVKCAAESRDIALDVLVDMLRHSKFDPDEIEREKGVIIEEMNMYYDTPRDFIGGVYEELLYDDQPLGWEIIGRKETIGNAKRETFNGYVDRWYRPSRMVVGVGGKIGDDLHERESAGRSATTCTSGSRSCSATRRRPKRDSPSRPRWMRTATRTSRFTRKPPTRLTSVSACTAIRSSIPIAMYSRCSRRCSAAGCRRASSPRCASAADLRTTSTG